jgi:hypothetical protein
MLLKALIRKKSCSQFVKMTKRRDSLILELSQYKVLSRSASNKLYKQEYFIIDI